MGWKHGLATACFGVATIIAAAPAAADPLDDMTDAEKGRLLASVLVQEGLPVIDPDRVLMLAQALCFSLDQGQSPSSTVTDVTDMTPWSSSDAAFFYGAATAAFCPEYSALG